MLYDEEANYIGRAKHVMLALGHGPLSFPPALAKARQDPAMADRIVQAYEPKEYDAGGRYIVIGAGHRLGQRVGERARRRRRSASRCAATRQPDEQDLNTPRCLFEAFGIDAFQALPFDQRIEFLGQILKGTSPERRRGWTRRSRRAARRAASTQLIGEIDEVKPGPPACASTSRARTARIPGWLDVTGVVAGTGFNKSALTVPLLRRLIEHYKVPVDGRAG